MPKDLIFDSLVAEAGLLIVSLSQALRELVPQRRTALESAEDGISLYCLEEVWNVRAHGDRSGLLWCTTALKPSRTEMGEGDESEWRLRANEGRLALTG